MIVWTGLLLTILLIKLMTGDIETEKEKKIFLVLSALAVAFVYGSRNAVIYYGTDLNNYYRIFVAATRLSWGDFLKVETVETGFLILNKAIASVAPWPQFYVYFSGALITGLLFRFIYKNVNDVFLGVLVFLSMGTFGFFLTAFRQSLAIVLCLWAFEYIKEKKLFKFVLVVLLAAIFHQTAIIFLSFYFLGNRKATRFNTILTFGGFFIAVFFTEFLLNWGNDIFDREFILRGSESAIGGIINIVVFLGTLIAGGTYLQLNKDNEAADKIKILFQMLLLGTGIYFMRFQALVMERVAFYYLPAIIALLPNMLKEVKADTGRRDWHLIIISFCIFIYLWRFFNYPYDYVFFWRFTAV